MLSYFLSPGEIPQGNNKVLVKNILHTMKSSSIYGALRPVIPKVIVRFTVKPEIYCQFFFSTA